MKDDVLDHHDGVVDHETYGGCQAAEGHQVEALAQQPKRNKCDRDVTGITRPATTDVPQSRRKRTRIVAASTSPMTMASRTLEMESLTRSD